MKKYFLLMLAVCGMLSVSGVSAKSLVLALGDGTLVYYQLGGNVNPMMKFVDGQVTVNADVYEFSGIKNFYISAENAPTAIGAVSDDSVRPSFDGKILSVNRADVEIAVYTTDGKKVEATVGHAGVYTTVDMSRLRRGLYVVRIGNTSLKLLKR
ncbi:MAG: T9SS type A sorting domain-containing protein [Paraprevotella sp.]|nr:T9SS type A sorting domain-containing protein [Paraprevotella sp.]